MSAHYLGYGWDIIRNVTALNADSMLLNFALGAVKKCHKYQPSGKEGTRSLPAMPHCLQNPKWPPGGPKMGEVVWKGAYF